MSSSEDQLLGGRLSIAQGYCMEACKREKYTLQHDHFQPPKGDLMPGSACESQDPRVHSYIL